ncbi:Hypothetical_protein [Hexamita inflata]|uniref:Hypothetical_protein n=1 Tax=Hexamita inflata TaxID=28002 RepID=A0AA86Q8S0_9EUKA|nr:Hypothetical protein HINF_LOCUS35859 [Hexamita inflata]CAI9948221.1 Hypothetical protein HINF_LOCUS35866 [Hexamita inflata]CAI9971000.1 Hypothetical protein HINF_LOCUS58645 [Hexamita inflata]
MFPQMIECLNRTYFALQLPINAAIFISLSSQLLFQIETKVIYILVNVPQLQSIVKSPIVPKLENQPFPNAEQLIFTSIKEILPPIVPKRPYQFKAEPAKVVFSNAHNQLIEIIEEIEVPIIIPELFTKFAVCFKQV